MQKLILYLQTDDLSQASWTLGNNFGGVGKTMSGDISELSALAADKELIVIIPAHDVLLTSATLPKLNRQRLIQALPFALEEQLLTDVNDLHFAIGAYQADGSVPVAIVAKRKMQKWIELLNQAGLFPTAILPAALALPVADDTWNIFLTDDIAIVRTDFYHGFGCDKDNLKELLALQLQEKLPANIHVNNYTTQAFEIISAAQLTEKKLAPTQFMEDLALRTESIAINLLQGGFPAKRKASHHKKIWQLAGYATLAWIGLVFVSNLISFSILHHQASSLDSKINVIYKHNFPQASAMVAPKERMTEKLNQLSNAGGKNPSLLWIAYIGTSLAEVSGIHLQQIDYRNNQLSMDVSAASADKLDSFAQSLRHQGVGVKQQNVVAQSSQVKGTLIISENKL